jgi:hypothetical protein
MADLELQHVEDVAEIFRTHDLDDAAELLGRVSISVREALWI